MSAGRSSRGCSRSPKPPGERLGCAGASVKCDIKCDVKLCPGKYHVNVSFSACQQQSVCVLLKAKGTEGGSSHQQPLLYDDGSASASSTASSFRQTLLEKLIRPGAPRRRPKSRTDSQGRSRAHRVAERKKTEGNELYKKKQYKEAIQLYSQAIDLCPETASFYSNRSACHMMLSRYPMALADAREAVRLDPSFVKGHVRVAKCNIALGDANAALSVLRRASEIEASSRVVKEEVENAKKLLKYAEQVAKAAERGDFRAAVFHLERAFELAPGCRTLKTTKAEYLVFLKRYTEAQLLANEILQADPCDVDALYVRGMCLYYQDNHDHAVTHFQHALRLTPDHKKAKDVYKKAKLLKTKKDAGNSAFTKGNYRQALELYTEALAIDTLNSTTNSKLFCNRATVKAKLNQLDAAVLDCTAALNLNESYVKALLRRAKCYQVLEKHDDAVRDYHRVVKIETTREHASLLEDAKEQQKRAKRKDYYKILGISKTAGEDEIKRSYKKMAMQHHPDRHANANDAEKREHEVKFKDIGEAYAILSDAKKRSMYDRGLDIDSSMCGGFNNDDDLLHMFRDYFPGGPAAPRQPGEYYHGGQQFHFDGNNGGDPSSRFFFQF